MKWFGYQRTPFGGWSPCTWHSQRRPDGKRAEGGQITIHVAAQLGGDELDMSLHQLAERYPPPQVPDGEAPREV